MKCGARCLGCKKLVHVPGALLHNPITKVSAWAAKRLTCGSSEGPLDSAHDGVTPSKNFFFVPQKYPFLLA